MKRRSFIALLVIFAVIVSAMNTGTIYAAQGTAAEETTAETASETTSPAFDSTAWLYNSSNDVYYQYGVVYCTDPDDTTYESLGIYVPAAYMEMESNGDGTYTFVGFTDSEVNGYTADTAPIVMPVNTAGYSAQAAPTGYSSDASEYTAEGFIYLYAGCRGRTTEDGGAPWGATDLKAAIRFYRLYADVLPGNTDAIFTFGHSGGGAQSAVVGASGDSELYYPYLYSIGAAGIEYDEATGTYSSTISDAICGAMCWCPITSLDYADEAYEWMMGQYDTSDSTRQDGTWTKELSDDMSEEFASYINSLTLTDESGNALTLSASDDGIYAAGSYYDYLLYQIEYSLNDFIDSYTDSDGNFNYSGSSGNTGDTQDSFPGDSSGPGGSTSGPGDSSSGPGSGFTNIQVSSADAQAASDDTDALTEYLLSIDENYGTDDAWITYDETTGWYSVRSIEDFVLYGDKSASKSVGAFDDLDLGQAENAVFGSGSTESAHFDSVMAELLSENYASYAAADSSVSESEILAYAEDYTEDYTSYTDSLGFSSQYRQNMYNPMYYLCEDYEGYGTSETASYWRINTGITQSDTSLTVEVNLYLALCEAVSDGTVEDVDFAMLWEQGHTTAERAGADSDECFREWVEECVADLMSSDDGTTDDGTTDDGTTDDGTTDDGTTDDGTTDDGTTDDGTTDDGTTDDGTTDDGTTDDGTTDDGTTDDGTTDDGTTDDGTTDDGTTDNGTTDDGTTDDGTTDDGTTDDGTTDDGTTDDGTTDDGTTDDGTTDDGTTDDGTTDDGITDDGTTDDGTTDDGTTDDGSADDETCDIHTAGEAVIENEVAATCTEEGSYDSVIYCTVCGEELSRETVTIAATGHSWTSVTVSAGSYGSTKETYTCSACGEEKTVTSLYGSSRYETASDIVASTFESCTYAVIADGSNFPDALAAASLAGALDAPILITSDSRIQDTIEELETLGVTYVYIVGGTSSVSAGAMSAIEAEGIEVERIAGDTRQLTAVAVAEEVLSITGTSDVCLVATGKTYADALAASPYAYWSASPIYLTNNDGSISDEVLASIEAAGYSRIIILGGTSSVTEATEEALSEIASVTRLGGDTRYETAEAIAAWSVEQGMSYDGLTVATGTNYPDALTASALCGKNGSVLLLSAASASGSSVLEEVITENAEDISDIYIVGGYSSVSEEIREMIIDALK